MNKITNLQNQKSKITCLTAYTYPIAKIVDKHCDVILVGDSLGMAIYGMENTRGVSVQMMIEHGKAVKRAAKKALIVVDIPFGSFEESKEQALETSQKILKETACDALKIEVTKDLIPIVKFLLENQIPIMGHIGLLPQKVQENKDYKYQGKDEKSAQEILEIALELEKIGVFAIVIEAVPEILASKITKLLKIPTIGIGASNNCDGQVLVIDDILGINCEFQPKFVKRFANLSEEIERAVQDFCQEVRNGKFPTEKHLKK
ncbi:MAG: 3-methyl-2-oxobutanoate hydroxymethyltransferase [Lentimonas sp.]|jgi:3-methyl-2-oxobutanoate hydroxymethyltransferase